MFVVLFFLISLFLPKIDLQGAALTLFSVNSFLYGFYISPIINAQRLRIDHLHRLVVIEVNKLQEIVQYSRRMESDFQNNVAHMINQYVRVASVGGANPGQKEFDNLVSMIVDYTGDKKDPHKEMLKSAFAAQQNRAEIKLLVESKVYSNEWIVMSILFAITIAFILFTRLPDILMLQTIPAILCAGLSMLILAAITVVAFNGVQERARNTMTISAVKDYIKLYSSYAVDYDVYPGSGNYCLGTGYQGDLCWDNRTYTGNAAANTGLLNYAKNLPNPSTARVYRNATDGYRAGILFVTPYSLRYQLEGVDTQCGINGATRAFTTGESTGPECNVTVPNPAL